MGKTPPFILNLLQPINQDVSSRLNRNFNTFSRLPVIHKNIFRNSFIPSIMIEWNNLDLSTRRCTSFNMFKRLIAPSRPALIALSNLSHLGRRGSILLTRLRNECSILNSHLFRSNLVMSPQCACNLGSETVFHYFWDCPFYDVCRETLVVRLSEIGILDWSINNLLYYENVPHCLVAQVQKIVCSFIVCSGRFVT